MSPRFWETPPDAPGWPARLLAPFSRNARLTRLSAPVPVVALSPLRAGVSPTLAAAALHLQLTLMRRKPGLWHVSDGPTRRVTEQTAATPDSAFLAPFGPFWTGAAAPADLEDRDILIALGGTHLAGDMTCLVAADHLGVGNGLPRPAGPLPASPGQLAETADGLILVSDPRARRQQSLPQPLATVPTARGALGLLPMGTPWSGRRLLAFAGGDDPGAVFAALKAEGAELAGAHAIAGDGPIPTALVQRLQHEAQAKNAQLVTTEGDMVRLPKAARPDVLALPLRLSVPDWTPLTPRLSAL